MKEFDTHCTHEKKELKWYDEKEDEDGNLVESHWGIVYTSYYEDVDLHRYKCSKCNKIFHY